ncbi:MAG: hypothetical protein Q8L90_18455 [Bacteroidota bacterium]|nr:hypothetical protein [Bacteroidota bacterium]
MYTLSDQQIDFILNDIKIRGVEMEDLQLNLLDHICCIIECELEEEGDFEDFYHKTIPKFFKKELKEIEEETKLLLTFKNYYAMKKTMIRTGIFSTIAIVLGSFFKVMHWPGAGVLLVLGIGSISLLFLPLMIILKTKDSNNKRDKIILASSAAVGFFLCWATLFAVMHWPGNGIFWIIAVCISTFVLIPVYFFTGIRDPETKLNTIITTIVLVAATGLQFTMINIRPAVKLTQIKMSSYIQGEELLKKIQNRSASGHQKNSTQQSFADNINNKAEQIKSMILMNAIGESKIPKDFESEGIIIEEGNLGIAFFDNGEGIKLLSELKAEISKYNASGEISMENKIPVDHSILDIDFDKIGRYSNYSVLNSITQIQMYLATAENKLTAFK